MSHGDSDRFDRRGSEPRGERDDERDEERDEKDHDERTGAEPGQHEAQAAQAAEAATAAGAAGAALDTLDALLRGSMRELDGETPPGYFEELPQRVDAAIEAGATFELEPGDAMTAADARDAREGRGKRRSGVALMAARGTLPPSDEPEPAGVATAVVSRRLGTAPPVAPSGRGQRRSMLETQLGAPQPWWHSKVAAAALAAGLAVALALIVTRGSDGGSDLGASSRPMNKRGHMADTRVPPVRVIPPAPPALSLDQLRLRQALASSLPEARACVGARPLDRVELTIELLPSGALGTVQVNGAASAQSAAACIIAAVQRLPVAAWSSEPLTITIPLFE